VARFVHPAKPPPADPARPRAPRAPKGTSGGQGRKRGQPLTRDEKEAGAKSKRKGKTADLPLSIDQQFLLVATYELAAFNSDSRQTAAQIVDQAKGHHCDPENVKRALADLVEDKHFLGSKTGRGGGYWLTPEGKRRAKRLKKSI
jgi:hypothetical protein